MLFLIFNFVFSYNGNETNKCDKMYIGTTKNKLKTRITAHKSDQRIKNSNYLQKTALVAHCCEDMHRPDFERTSIIESENNYKRRYMLEMLHINNVPTDKRMNYRCDTENLAQSFRHLIRKRNA